MARGIDWASLAPKIEPIYRAGTMNNSALAKKFGISRQSLIKYAKDHGWERDLKERIHRKVDASLNEDLAKDRLNGEEAEEARNRIIVEEVAATQVEVVRTHRKNIRDLREITDQIAQKLKAQVDNGYTMMEIPSESGETTSVRVPADILDQAKTLNQLSSSLQRLVDMERTAFGIDQQGDDAVPSEVKTVMEMVLGAKEGLPGATA